MPPARLPRPQQQQWHAESAHRTIGLKSAGALAVAGHLGLGGAALASPWTGLDTDIVLAVVGVKVIAVIVMACASPPVTGEPPRPRRIRPRRTRRVHGLAARPSHRLRRRNRDPEVDDEIRSSCPDAKGERYAKQLCSHAAWKAPRAEWTPPEGVIEFPDDMGTCRITAEPDHLVLAV
jgi:hypothetical protein